MVAAAVVAAGALSAGATALSSSQAAGAQTSAANAATNAQLGMFNTTRAGLSPFLAAGTNSASILNQLLGGTALSPGVAYGDIGDSDRDAAWAAILKQNGGDLDAARAEFSRLGASGQLLSVLPGQNTPLPAGLTNGMLLKPFGMDQAALEATPGYQFTLSQGLKAVNNANAARGLGVSGANLRGAADYATGLADSTYNQQFQNYLTQQDAIFNRLSTAASLGENAGAQTGSFATQTGANVGGNIIGAGNAQAAAAMANANAVSGAANNVSSLFTLRSLLNGSNANAKAGVFDDSVG